MDMVNGLKKKKKELNRVTMFLCKEMQNICDLEFMPVFQLNSLRTGFSKKEEYFTA